MHKPYTARAHSFAFGNEGYIGYIGYTSFGFGSLAGNVTVICNGNATLTSFGFGSEGGEGGRGSVRTYRSNWGDDWQLAGTISALRKHLRSA